MTRLRQLLLTLAALLAWLPGVALAQSFPALTGRVVDDAKLLSAEQAAALGVKLAQLEQQSGRQLVVVTLPDLQGYDIADYGYQLGRKWGIGTKEKNDGALLIVAPNERRVRIEAGYGLEGILTDAMSALIINNAIVPRFRANDFPGGIDAGVDEIGTLLRLPPDEARQRAAQAAAQAKRKHDDPNIGGAIIVLIFVFFFVVLPMIHRARGGRRYGGGPIILWGPGLGGGRDDDDHFGGWGGGGGGGWGGGGGGFSGGGGSFGGGGASGGW